MKLYYSPTSPYTRRVSAALILLGLDGQVERISVSPFDAPAELTQVNPLSQIPTLVLDSGEMLCGSGLIVEYLNAQTEQRSLMDKCQNHWQMKNLAGIAEGIVDAALAVILETRRPAEQQSATKIQGWQDKIMRSLAFLEQHKVQASTEKIDFYSLALGIALGYLDFRQAELNWRDSAPGLCEWYAQVRSQAWLEQTQPPS